MTPETFKYLIIGLFCFVVIGAFYLVFKSGFKLKKHDKSKQLFGIRTKEERRKDIFDNILIIGLFILFIVIFDEFSS